MMASKQCLADRSSLFMYQFMCMVTHYKQYPALLIRGLERALLGNQTRKILANSSNNANTNDKQHERIEEMHAF